MKVEYCSILPHDEIVNSFIKQFESLLLSEGFEKKFEHNDPGGVDVYRYEDAKENAIVITCSPMEADNEEINISSEWHGLSELVDRAADEFANNISKSIKRGRKD